MTEELIDVKKCGYYKEGDCLACPVTCEEYIDCDFKTIFSLKQENNLLKEQLLKKSETEEALQSTIEAIKDANTRITQCTSILRDINEIIKHYHLQIGGEVVGADTIYKIEKKIKEVLKCTE